MSEVKELRLEKKLTQQQVADLVGISLRSYKSYENDKGKEGTIKYAYILDKLKALNPIDEAQALKTLEAHIRQFNSLYARDEKTVKANTKKSRRNVQ